MDLSNLDLDDLKALITILRDSEVSEFSYAGMTLKFPPVAPAADRPESPMSPTVDRPPTNAPHAYVRLLGPTLPQWPKAE